MCNDSWYFLIDAPTRVPRDVKSLQTHRLVAETLLLFIYLESNEVTLSLMFLPGSARYKQLCHRLSTLLKLHTLAAPRKVPKCPPDPFSNQTRPKCDPRASQSNSQISSIPLSRQYNHLSHQHRQENILWHRPTPCSPLAFHMLPTSPSHWLSSQKAHLHAQRTRNAFFESLSLV
jgi:hypothetical protein